MSHIHNISSRTSSSRAQSHLLAFEWVLPLLPLPIWTPVPIRQYWLHDTLDRPSTWLSHAPAPVGWLNLMITTTFWRAGSTMSSRADFCLLTAGTALTTGEAPFTVPNSQLGSSRSDLGLKGVRCNHWRSHYFLSSSEESESLSSGFRLAFHFRYRSI